MATAIATIHAYIGICIYICTRIHVCWYTMQHMWDAYIATSTPLTRILKGMCAFARTCRTGYKYSLTYKKEPSSLRRISLPVYTRHRYAVYELHLYVYETV